jgi:hypothetical protein
MTKKYYQELRIYRKKDENILLYICLKDIKVTKYCVNQMEIFNENNIKNRYLDSIFNFFDMFLDKDIEKSMNWFSDIESAIENFDAEFDIENIA